MAMATQSGRQDRINWLKEINAELLAALEAVEVAFTDPCWPDEPECLVTARIVIAKARLCVLTTP